MSAQQFSICRVVLPAEAPARVLVVPWGEVKSKSSDFVVNDESAASVVAAFAAHGVDLPIDYEHQTLGDEFASPTGLAPAAGWIKKLTAEPGVGIWAEVEWTQRAAEMIAAKEYRYLSPVVIFRKGDKVMLELHSVGLTNTPAIAGMSTIANKLNAVANAATAESVEQVRWWLNLPATATAEEILMELEKFLAQLRELAGAPATADQAAVVAALKQRIESGGSLRTAVCKALEVKPEASDESIVKAAAALKAAPPNAGDAVPRAEFDAVAHSLRTATTELAELRRQMTDRAADERIANALRAGKLTEAMIKPDEKGENYFRTLARDEQAWNGFIGRQPVVAPPDGQRVSHKPPPAADGDVIRANAVRFSAGRMGDYDRIAGYAREHKISFEKAAVACGAL